MLVLQRGYVQYKADGGHQQAKSEGDEDERGPVVEKAARPVDCRIGHLAKSECDYLL